MTPALAAGRGGRSTPTLCEFVASQSLDLGDSARMFALVTMATADTIISCWSTKIHYNFWRPITAIRGRRERRQPGDGR